jgi:hypothetical protein
MGSLLSYLGDDLPMRGVPAGMRRGVAPLIVVGIVAALSGCSPAGKHANVIPQLVVTNGLVRSGPKNYIPDSGFEHGLGSWLPYQSGLLSLNPPWRPAFGADRGGGWGGGPWFGMLSGR